MRRVFVMDADQQGQEKLLRLLRENGYAVTPGGEGGQSLLMVSEARPLPAEGTDGEAAHDSGIQAHMDTVVPPPVPHGQELWQRLLDSPTPQLLSRAADGAVLDGNLPFVQLSGYDRDEMAGRDVLGFFFFLDPEQWTEAFRRLEAEGEVPDLDTRIFKKNGLVAFVRVSLRRAEVDGLVCHLITLRERPPGAIAEAETVHTGSHDTPPESPTMLEVDFNRQEVGRLMDFEALQDLMNSFYKITRIGIGINDTKGNVQVATGWQDVCIRFHRMHPETLKNCLESDIHLSRELGQGEAIYKCRNGMWDMATPLVIGGRHIANIFLGQFFFEGEVPDYDFYRKQAEAHGFDVDKYLEALDRVPRWSPQLVRDAMEFYRKLAGLISRLSIANIRISQALDEQKRISEELSQAKLVVENSPVVLFRWRAQEGWPVDLVSDNVARFGYSREELLSGSVSFSSLVHPDDLPRVALEVQEYTAAGIDRFQQEYRIVTRDGQSRWIDDRTLVERDGEGRITHYQGTVMDITERKRAEEALRQSETRVREIFENAPIGIFRSTLDGKFISVNPATARILKYDSPEELMDTVNRSSIQEALYLEPHQRRDLVAELLPSRWKTHEVRYRCKDGSIVTGNFHIRRVPGADGSLSELEGFVEDITDRKKAEEALRESEERLRSIFRVAPVGIGVVRDRVLQEVNRRLCDMTGYAREELVGENALMLYPDREEFELVGRVKYLQIEEKGTGAIETRWRRKDGAVIDILLSSTPLHPSDLSKGVTFTALDITERKRAEEALKESEEKFRVLAETLPAAIMLHQGGKFIYVNPATTRITGYDETELLEMNFWEWCRMEDWDVIRERGQARLRGETVPPQYEYRMITKNGEERWVIVSAGITDYRGRSTIIATLIDISEAKRAEERIQAALAEKIVLLKEVHHRVKNNLQIISSLLDLQSDAIPDEQSRGYFRESQNRVRSMALVHEQIYKSKDLSSIDFRDYIRDLAQRLLDTYGVGAERICLQVSDAEVSLAINEAIPCGLIVNELVSNALKYAFPAQTPGEISIHISEDDGRIGLRVADTGVGLPAGLDFRNTATLGLQLVTMLVRQLRGHLAVESHPGEGTCVTISFPVSGSA